MNAEPNFRRRPAERGPEILDAAMALFAERGFEKTRIVDIAQRAGVSHGTVGLYFPTKEALLRGVIERMAEPQMDEAERLIDGFEGSTADLLETIGLFWWTHCQEENVGAIVRVVEAELGNFPELAETYRTRVYDPVVRLFVRIVERGVRRAEYRCEDPVPFAELGFGGLGYMLDWNEGLGRVLNRPIDAQRYISIWAHALACGLASGAGTQPSP